jgi:hypothetical protein
MPLTLGDGSVVGDITVQHPSLVTVGIVAIPAGAAVGSEAFEFVQVSPSASWDIALPGSFPSRRPAVTLYDNAGNEVESDVIWSSGTRHIAVVFPSPVSGVAVIT